MYATVKLNNEMVWSCMECGCLVADKVRHDMWHVNTIGRLQSSADQATRGDDRNRGGR